MDSLISKINALKKSEISKQIHKRYNQFLNFKKTNHNLFSELCFCILTANYNAEKAIVIQNSLKKDFIYLSESQLVNALKKYGYRYPNVRAKYIVYNRKYFFDLKNVLKKYSGDDLRKWFVENIKGYGYKEASHFLRNIGYEDYAIIDFHIVDLLIKENIIKKPKTLTPKIYLQIEKKLYKLGKKLNLSLGELDLYLWYLETGKILK
ncbi:MAG TPA: N-glycosylase/DNA lyase [archaeon]|nr:N-glycosylase/DNA lyase [archaeon]